METMFRQNFGGQTKYYCIFESDLLKLFIVVSNIFLYIQMSLDV